MILFFYQRVKKRIFHNKKLYLMIFIEVILGSAIISVFLNINSSINKGYNTLLREGKNNIYDLQITSLPLFEEVKNLKTQQSMDMYIPFTYDDYSYFKSRFKDNISVKLSIDRDIYFILPDSPKMINCHLIFASDELIKEDMPQLNIGDFENQNAVLAGDKFMECLQKGRIVNEKDLVFSFSKDYEDEIVIEEKRFHRQNLDSMTDKTLFLPVRDKVNEKKQVDLDYTMVIPVKYYYDFFKVEDILHFNISFIPNKTLTSTEQIFESIIYLNNNHGSKYEYNIDSTLNRYIRKTEDVKMISYAANLIAVFSIIVIIIGLAGILLMLIDKRKREVAISIALGATKKHIASETILEAVLVTLPAGIIGIIASVFILKSGISIEEINITADTGILVCSILISAFIGLISSIFPVVKVRKMLPLEILRNL